MNKLESIEKQIEELKQKKIAELKKQKTKELAQKRKDSAQKRKLESHLKIIIGGYVIAKKNTKLLQEMLSSELRENDRKELKKLITLLEK